KPFLHLSEGLFSRGDQLVIGHMPVFLRELDGDGCRIRRGGRWLPGSPRAGLPPAREFASFGLQLGQPAAAARDLYTSIIKPGLATPIRSPSPLTGWEVFAVYAW